MRIWFAYVGTVWSTLMVLISSWLILLAVTADFNCCWCLVLFKLLSNFPYLVIPVWHSCHKIITRLPGKISWLRAVEWRALATYSNICWFSYDLLTYRLTFKCSVENKLNLKYEFQRTHIFSFVYKQRKWILHVFLPVGSFRLTKFVKSKGFCNRSAQGICCDFAMLFFEL